MPIKIMTVTEFSIDFFITLCFKYLYSVKFINLHTIPVLLYVLQARVGVTQRAANWHD